MDSRNRLWWVMGGVALLLVVVLTGGLYWLRPVDSVARADLALPRPTQDAQPFEFVATPGVSAASERPPGEIPTGEPAAAETADTTETAETAETADTAPASSLAAASPAPAAAATESQPVAARQPKPRITLDTQEPAVAAATPAAAPEVRAIATTGARTGGGAPAVPASAVEAKRSVPLAKLAPKLAPRLPLHEFWVQVGSFASRARANALEQRLSDHGIISRVTTRSTDTDVFFRVRVGPYGSRKEAEKFLAWVQQVDGMDGSYISEVRNSGG